MYLCVCKGLTERDVAAAGRAGCVTAEALLNALGLEDTVCCGRCACNIDDFVAVATRARADLRGTPTRAAPWGLRGSVSPMRLIAHGEG
jgi:bacterioferritin-associated ferredoxin